MGIGLAAGAGGSSQFIGAGFTWNSATAIGGASGDANNTAYISYGPLDADAGPYGVRTHGPANAVNGYGL